MVVEFDVVTLMATLVAVAGFGLAVFAFLVTMRRDLKQDFGTRIDRLETKVDNVLLTLVAACLNQGGALRQNMISQISAALKSDSAESDEATEAAPASSESQPAPS